MTMGAFGFICQPRLHLSPSTRPGRPAEVFRPPRRRATAFASSIWRWRDDAPAMSMADAKKCRVVAPGAYYALRRFPAILLAGFK